MHSVAIDKEDQLKEKVRASKEEECLVICHFDELDIFRRTGISIFTTKSNLDYATMEKHVRTFLHKISYCCITIATITLLLIILETPETCVDLSDPNTKFHHRFPKSTCDYKHRVYTSLEKRNKRLWATSAWSHAVKSYVNLFQTLQSINLLFNHSHSLVVSAGPGQAVMALKNMGLDEVIGVEITDSPPLVSRADPHNLPFFDDVFDFGFSPFLDRALFPGRYVSELERTVRVGGVCLVAVEECGPHEVEEIVKLFKKSQYLEAKNETLAGEKMTRIILKVTSP